MRIDNKQLADLVERCFDLSMDGRVSEEDQKRWLVLGKRLRGQLVNLISAKFAANTAQVEAASARLAAVNAKIAASQAHIDGVADALADAEKLLGILDELLPLATHFV